MYYTVMPSKNSLKNYDSDSMYHIYNRGNDKRIVFTDEKDYAVFLSFLKFAFLSDEENSANELITQDDISQATRFNLRRIGIRHKAELVAFCLMPNHFHLLIYQYDVDAIPQLMRSIMTGYVVYFNKRHDRSGRLFQGVYKASHVNSESYWQHISRYIHLNPLDLQGVNYENYDYSSMRMYLDKAHAEWLTPHRGMSGMSSGQYKSFVKEWIPKHKNENSFTEILADR